MKTNAADDLMNPVSHSGGGVTFFIGRRRGCGI